MLPCGCMADAVRAGGGDGDVVIEQAPLLQPITADKAADLVLKRKAPPPERRPPLKRKAPGARKR